MTDLDEAQLRRLTRPELQALAKDRKIKANLKTETIIERLLETSQSNGKPDAEKTTHPATPLRRNAMDKETLQRSMAPSPRLLPTVDRQRLKNIQTPRSPQSDVQPEDETQVSSTAGRSNAQATSRGPEPQFPTTPRRYPAAALHIGSASVALTPPVEAQAANHGKNNVEMRDDFPLASRTTVAAGDEKLEERMGLPGEDDVLDNVGAVEAQTQPVYEPRTPSFYSPLPTSSPLPPSSPPSPPTPSTPRTMPRAGPSGVHTAGFSRSGSSQGVRDSTMDDHPVSEHINQRNDKGKQRATAEIFSDEPVRPDPIGTDAQVDAYRAVLRREIKACDRQMRQRYHHYAKIMEALGHRPRDEPTIQEWMNWNDESRDRYLHIPEPDNDAFPNLNAEEWESLNFHSDSDGEFGDENGDDGMDDQQREFKRLAVNYLEADIEGLNAMYGKKISGLKKITRDIVYSHRAALCVRRAAAQEGTMRGRINTFIALCNERMEPRWTEDEVWVGFPIRLKRKDGRFVELASDEERGSEDEPLDPDSDDAPDAGTSNVAGQSYTAASLELRASAAGLPFAPELNPGIRSPRVPRSSLSPAGSSTRSVLVAGHDIPQISRTSPSRSPPVRFSSRSPIDSPTRPAAVPGHTFPQAPQASQSPFPDIFASRPVAHRPHVPTVDPRTRPSGPSSSAGDFPAPTGGPSTHQSTNGRPIQQKGDHYVLERQNLAGLPRIPALLSPEIMGEMTPRQHREELKKQHQEKKMRNLTDATPEWDRLMQKQRATQSNGGQNGPKRSRDISDDSSNADDESPTKRHKSKGSLSSAISTRGLASKPSETDGAVSATPASAAPEWPPQSINGTPTTNLLATSGRTKKYRFALPRASTPIRTEAPQAATEASSEQHPAPVEPRTQPSTPPPPPPQPRESPQSALRPRQSPAPESTPSASTSQSISLIPHPPPAGSLRYGESVPLQFHHLSDELRAAFAQVSDAMAQQALERCDNPAQAKPADNEDAESTTEAAVAEVAVPIASTSGAEPTTSPTMPQGESRPSSPPPVPAPAPAPAAAHEAKEAEDNEDVTRVELILDSFDGTELAPPSPQVNEATEGDDDDVGVLAGLVVDSDEPQEIPPPPTWNAPPRRPPPLCIPRRRTVADERRDL